MKESSKQKINAVLGIEEGQSVDDFLDSLEADSAQISSTFNGITEEVKKSISSIDSKVSQLSSSSDSSTAVQLVMKDIDTSLYEVEDLIQVSKKLFKHVYEGIVTTDLIDSELVGAAAKMLESIHINIKEFIDLYKERQRYVDKVKLMVFQQEQRKEMEQLKHKLAMERLKMKSEEGDKLLNPEAVTYDISEIVKALDRKDRAAEAEFSDDAMLDNSEDSSAQIEK